MLHVDLTQTHALVPYSLGFCLLARKQQLKLDLDAGGPTVMQQLVVALIASGFDTEEEIVDQICDITGAHAEEPVRLLLMEGENNQWIKRRDGRLVMSTDCW